ncbi:hypothetical protein JDV02_007348 [Purpureocillium takamizusanense]|uniref:Uncharacterized protein n=1 Tax=Purpureocillium takamizusanense TaxID=2060973 RepID=A0A9Q8QMV3_9HYPO|nr:uncharacterized protein JDV02_007348 [Purpureocillium takamizusanense]UNI21352.1 hypothetical protein JDV02_007348 [Purpureocillium takamizusanense]
MTQRKGLGGKYPATFSEWVCGISIEDALGPRNPPQPPPQRKVVRVEITTDDETEEDSLKVTYPRTSRVSSRQEPDVIVKKVRFEDTPKKSALKKTATVVTESDTDPSSKDGAADSESSDTAPEKTSDPDKNGTDQSTSEASSDTEGSSKCAKCAQRRKRAGSNAKDSEKQCASDSEASQSSTDSTRKGKKHGKQAKPRKDADTAAKEKNDASEADDEASDTGRTSADESDAPPSKDNAKNKQKASKKGSGKQPQASSDKGQKAQKKQEPQHSKEQPSKSAKTESKKKQKDSEKRNEVGKQRHDNKKGDYPEAYLKPHPRRPHLIEPIRAEVVQTEKVIEGPEDPPPNAYYDPEHGVLRVYHGPVYGNHYSQGLYPRRDASARPLPIGMPHPLHNPYYHGFNQAPPQQSGGNEPVTQGMPMPAWGSMYPPPGFLTGYQAGTYGPWQPDVNTNNAYAANNTATDINVTGTQGVFSLVEDKSGTASSNLRDKDGQNNITPGGFQAFQGHDNPYLPKRTRSTFSTYGSRVPSNASQASKANATAGSNADAKATVPGNDGPGDTGAGKSSGGAWGNNAQNNSPDQQQNQWGSTDHQNHGWDSSQQTNGAGNDGGWGSASNGQNGETNGNSGWGNDNDHADNNNAGGWGGDAHTADTPAKTASQWGDSGGTDNSAPSVVNTNNVMPGSWDAPAAAPAWGDPSMAASTNGQVDAVGW